NSGIFGEINSYFYFSEYAYRIHSQTHVPHAAVSSTRRNTVCPGPREARTKARRISGRGVRWGPLFACPSRSDAGRPRAARYLVGDTGGSDPPPPRCIDPASSDHS